MTKEQRMGILYKRMRQFKEQWGVASYYRKMYNKGSGKWSSLIQLDIKRTLGSIHSLRYCFAEAKVARVIRALVNTMGSLGYCQGMTLLAVSLFSRLNNEEVRSLLL
eukprot:TRINITY_DN9259_c0_g1_i1.p4 TRINITY_DN9259_c0_g1~~TRINITY_DN9259_c0_g1_i1.p4  ORF type:complete len:107 (+),score=12.28 TRINITY_DN9259_c0_g1_i1:621-941(+)